MKYLIALLFFLCIFYGKSIAQNYSNGCYVSSTSPARIYFDSYGNGNNNGYVSYWEVECNGTNSEYVVQTGSLGGACDIPNTYPKLKGKRTSYTVTQCPIDNYSQLLLLSAGSLGFFALRRRK